MEREEIPPVGGHWGVRSRPRVRGWSGSTRPWLKNQSVDRENIRPVQSLALQIDGGGSDGEDDGGGDGADGGSGSCDDGGG